MLSWATNRSTIVSGLPSGYVLIPRNREPDSDDRAASHNHKAYSLKLRGVAEELLSSDIMHYTHAIMMRVIYKAVDGTQLITNEELAMTLMNTISNISGFVNFIENPLIEELDTDHIIFNLAFHFGQDDNE